MSVLIRGMEMPKNCDECPLYTCMHNHDNCPLVPVPPHGRLIDGDAVVREIESVCGTHWTTIEIKRAPTIIPAEEGE